MRGKVRTNRFPCSNRGITPAYAGKSRKPVHRRKPVQDHPRLCGEKTAISTMPSIKGGSPPPMRGKALDASDVVLNRRITPAYAGKRPFEKGSDRRSRDHPRLCGEKTGNRVFDRPEPGSPPPMRGKGLLNNVRSIDIRITPAYAGKSQRF